MAESALPHGVNPVDGTRCLCGWRASYNSEHPEREIRQHEKDTRVAWGRLMGVWYYEQRKPKKTA